VGQTIYPDNRGRLVKEGETDKLTKKRGKWKERVEQRRRSRDLYLGREGCTWIFFAVAHDFLVTPLLMGPVCLLNQGRCEEPVRSCWSHQQI